MYFSITFFIARLFNEKLEFFNSLTGIRPGEKLEEELFYNPSSVHPTAHPKVFSANLKSFLQLDDLDELLELGVARPELALPMLCKMVPEYRPDHAD